MRSRNCSGKERTRLPVAFGKWTERLGYRFGIRLNSLEIRLSALEEVKIDKAGEQPWILETGWIFGLWLPVDCI